MTLVVAAKFNDRIVVVSDTMISGDHLTRNDLIPGQLKSVVLNGKLSVSYAGSVSTGLRIIREARKLVAQTNNLSCIIDFIYREHLAALNTNYSCDFIIISHFDEPRMLRISDGVTSQGGDRYWIGNSTPIQNLSQAEDACPIFPIHPIQSPEEMRFRWAMMNVLLDPAANAEFKVGGLIVQLLGSPFGHCYDHCAFAKNWNEIHISSEASARQKEDRESGMTQFVCHIIGSLYRGAGVVGAFIEQAKVGYIYRPAETDNPDKLYPCTAAEMATCVTSHAIRMGGFLNEA